MTKAKVTGLAAALSVFLPALVANAAIPHATCRSTDVGETGLAGETTAAEIDAGLPAAGFTCNTDLVGQYQGEGASWQLTAWKNCAYFDQRHPGSAGSSGEKDAGVAVVDVTDPTNPTVNLFLDEPAMIDPWESLKVNPARQLLGADQRPLSNTSPADGFSVYDISGDCLQPVLQASIVVPGSFGHTGQWAPDGKTYYVTPLKPTPSIIAIDVTDPKNPAGIPGGIFTFLTPTTGGDGGVTTLANSQLHDLEFSKDGNTAYITMFGLPAFGSSNGFAILDVSDFQQRRANPQYRVVSQITWNDGSFGAQNALPITIAGKPYILLTDEAGAGFLGATNGCTAGMSANGFARLIDISDPHNPVVASKIILDVADPANCAHMSTAPVTSTQTTLADGGISTTTGPSFFGHSCHYCNVDDVDDAKIAGCNCFAAGLRFFDIHDINNVKEMAYFKPPAQGAKPLPGSQYANSSTPTTFVREFDWATSKVSFPKDRGETSGDVWTTSQDNGFMVVHLFSSIRVVAPSSLQQVGVPETLTATVTGAIATSPGITWSLPETSGATISQAGLFNGTAVGTYHPTATSNVFGNTGSTAITVYSAAPAQGGSGSGCSAAPTSAAGVMGVLLPLGWLLLRRQRRRQ